MQCSECSYVLGPFDPECPRCRNLRDKGLPLPSEVKRREAEEAENERVRAEVEAARAEALAGQEAARAEEARRTEEARQESTRLLAALSPPPSPPLRAAPSSALPVGALGCPVCGGQDTQKVSAIYRAGSWSARTSGVSETVGMVWDGPMFVAGSQSVSHTAGASRLAQALAPPARPSHPEIIAAAPVVGTCMMIFCGLMALVSLPFCLILIGRPTFFLGLIGALASLFAICRHVWACGKRSEAEAQMPRWLAVMDAWGRLFYCGRCDHVFLPTTGQAAPAGQMHSLL